MAMIQNKANDSSFAHGPGRTISLFGATGSIKAASADTNGRLGLIELTLPPHFRGLTPHWHAKTTEAFYILDGTLAFTLAEQTFTITRGGFVLAPPRTLHHFWNPTAAPATLLNFCTPGGLEACFAELATAFANTPFDAEQLIAIAAQYDQFPPPVLEMEMQGEQK